MQIIIGDGKSFYVNLNGTICHKTYEFKTQLNFFFKICF